MSNRGAKPIPATESASPTLDGELLQERNQQIAMMHEHQRTVIDEFGDGLPWSPEHYEGEIRNELRRGCESFLRAGRYLVVVRECAALGEWQSMLDRLGLEGSQARRMMEAARRVAALPDRATSHALASAAKSNGKLIELLSLPEDQFTELATEGEIEGLSLEDVGRMTVRELRAAIKEARADLQAKDDRAAKREAEIESLQKQLRRAKNERARATPNEDLEKLRTKASSAALQVRADIAAQGEDDDSLTERFAQLRAQAVDMGLDGTEQDMFMAGLIGELLCELRRVRDDMGLPIVSDHGAPDWMQG